MSDLALYELNYIYSAVTTWGYDILSNIYDENTKAFLLPIQKITLYFKPMGSEETDYNKSEGILEKFLLQKKATLAPIQSLNIEKMTQNLTVETTEEQNLLKMLKFKKLDKTCLEGRLGNILSNDKSI